MRCPENRPWPGGAAWPLVLIAALWLSACPPAHEADLDPLASLASAEVSTTYTAQYWGDQAKDDTSVWRQALEVCRTEANQLLPNCRTVQQVHFIRILRASAERRSGPYDGQDGVEFPEALQDILTAQTDPPATAADPERQE